MSSEPEEETFHKQTINIEGLKTRSVTLYPARASIVRDIENVTIKPGRSEITILGLSRYADENTIKVEGHGTDALITDMTVEEVRRKDNDPDDEDDQEEPKSVEIEEVNGEIEDLQQEIDDIEETLRSCSNQVAYAEQHTLGLSNMSTRAKLSSDTTTQSMIDSIHGYGEFRAKIYKEYKVAQTALKKLRIAMAKKRLEADKLERAWTKSQQEARDERLKKREQKAENPVWVKKITITIELDSLPKNTQSVVSTISTGRPARASDDEPPAESKGPSLRISYIVSGASWSPRYDLRLDTTSETGVLTYRAESLNRTGETWRDATVTLSTSQTAFTGLEDKVPWMDSWRLGIRKQSLFGSTVGSELYSQKERQMRVERRKQQSTFARALFSTTFPAYSPQSPGYSPTSPTYSPASPPPILAQSQAQGFGATVQTPAYGGGLFGGASTGGPPATGGGLFGSAPGGPPTTSGGLFGRASGGPPTTSGGLFGSAFGGQPAAGASTSNTGGTSSNLFGQAPAAAGGDDPYDSDASDSNSGTLNPPGKMGLALSSLQSYGLTTTYDLPGARTIPSSRLSHRHVITEISLPDVELSHIAVPKLRAAVFLKAKIRNASSTPLLRGPVGLTLDGSFLGNSTIGRCAPNDTFELGLGIDEEILVDYRKPVRKMASQGMLVKEQVATYERGIRLYNARGKVVKLLLFDQVPISEDDKLKIVILNPRGLRTVGDVARISSVAASSASSVRSSFMETKETGGIEVELRKGGEIRYHVSLEKGKEVFLPLEYEARLPAGETMSEI